LICVNAKCHGTPHHSHQFEQSEFVDPMALTKIRLELARTKDSPTGNPNHGYELIAPLDEAGKLDSKSWVSTRQLCSVRRFAPKTTDEHGLLIHTARKSWVFSYQPGEEDDEPVYRLEDHQFKEGEYVSVKEHDGVIRPFKVVSMTRWNVHPINKKKPAA
jgi:hypothetical protein